MASHLLPLLLVLVSGVAVFTLMYTLLSTSEDEKVLEWASGRNLEKSSSALLEWSKKVVKQLLISYVIRWKLVNLRKKIENTLLISGMSREITVDEFIGIKVLWGALFPTLLFFLIFALRLEIPIWIPIVMIPFGFQIPDFHANKLRKERVLSVRQELPFYIDLLALSTEAGLDFQGSISRIVEKAQPGSVLAVELETMLKEITLGSSRSQALRGMQRRLDMSEIQSLVNVIIDADQTGASIARVLKDQSVQMRLERFVRAEKAGARASQAMLIPLVIFILPAVLLVVMAPVALQFLYGKG